MKKLWLIPLAFVLVMPIIPVASAQLQLTVDIVPDSLNVLSNRKYITCYLELPGYDLNLIDISTLYLKPNGVGIPVDIEAPAIIGDYDNDGIPDLKVKFSAERMYELFYWRGIVQVVVLGNLVTGEEIVGADLLRIVESGKPN